MLTQQPRIIEPATLPASTVPFHVPPLAGTEERHVRAAIAGRKLHGDQPFGRQCEAWLEDRLEVARAFLTPSCSHALEMCALLLDLREGDEFIVPSFAFSTTAGSFVLRGARPVFVDVRPDTLSLDEREVAAAITDRTKAVVVIHYAGVAAALDELMLTCVSRGIPLVEDAAQALLSTYKGRPLGGIGTLGAVSFHQTKNVGCGEGGALFVNDPTLAAQAEIIREKGTDRARYLRGEVDRYMWQSVGSSYLLGEMSAAYLYAQLEIAREVTDQRLQVWRRYHDGLESLEAAGLLRRPALLPGCEQHNAHIYFVIVRSPVERAAMQAHLSDRGIETSTHYVPLHSSPAGLRYGRPHGSLRVTSDLSSRLLRLPVWAGCDVHAERVLDAIHSFHGWTR